MDPSASSTGAFQAPPGNTARQIGALCIVPALIPFLVLQSLAPVLKGGMDIWMASWLPDIAVSGVVGAIVAVGLVRHSRWFYPFVSTFSRVVLAVYVLGFLLGLALLAGAAPRVTPNLGFMNVVNVVEWVVFSPLIMAVGFLARSRYVRSQLGA